VSAARSLLCFDIDCESRLKFHCEVVGKDGDLLDELFYQSFVELCDVCFLLGDKVLQFLDPVHDFFPAVADEIDALREEKQDLLVEDANRAAMKQRLDELEEFLDEHQEPVTDYDEGMVRRLIERITVYEDHLDFEFKSGLETEVQM
jgi:hypothetical protein